MSFQSLLDLKKFLADNPPRHVYYSSARYREPANPIMDEKKWLGSDLVFDIDANEIRECIEIKGAIQLRFCNKCGYTTTESEARICPYCSSELKKFDHISFKCINMAKDHIVKLLDILREDFGFKDIVIAFSGHRGFHMVVELNEDYRYLSSDERREIVSYIKLSEQYAKYFRDYLDKIVKQVQYIPLLPRVTDGGIRRRIALSLTRYVDDDIKSYILGLKRLLTFIEAQKAYNILIERIDNIIRDISIAIDSKVTIDITHLIRVPNSVNGKTGWRVIPIKNTDIKEFEIFAHDLAISDAKIKIKFLINLPEIEIIDTNLRFTKGDEAVLEYPYASYFIFKEVAIAINIVR